MSFRTRLTSFFVLIVIVPMIAIGVLGFRLISDSEQGKADARAGGLADACDNAARNAEPVGRIRGQSERRWERLSHRDAVFAWLRRPSGRCHGAVESVRDQLVYALQPGLGGGVHPGVPAARAVVLG